MSADTTPTSVTSGKSWPLAIICVPTRTSSSRGAKRRSTASMAPLPPRGVAIDAGDARARHHGLHLGLDALGADAAIVEELAAAGRARRRQRPAVVAVVALGAARGAVHGQRDAAVRALERRGAGAAEVGGGVAAPVEQHDALLAVGEPRGERRLAAAG